MLARIAMAAGVALIAAGTGWGQLIATEEAKLTSGDSATDLERFGNAVAISGETALVGAYWSSPGGISSGAAYVFVRSGNTWTLQQKLVASDAGIGDYFGYSVALSGDTAVIGAVGDDLEVAQDAGSAYVFVRSGTTWIQQQKLTASHPAVNDVFGCSVAVSGDTAVVGAYMDNNAGGLTDVGSAYVFVRSGTAWSQQQMLVASDPGPLYFFGISASIWGDTVVVGSSGDSQGGFATYEGSAYVFVRSGARWREQQKLIASDVAEGDSFGNSVACLDDTIVVGAYGDDLSSIHTDAGSAYVFVRSGASWSEQQKLVASDAQAGDFCGYSVALLDETIVVGSPRDDHLLGANAGSALVFVRSGTVWNEEAKFSASDAQASALFGVSVAASGDLALVGAYGDDNIGGTDAGAAYVFQLSPGPVTYCTAGTSASGCQATLSASGTPSASAPSGFDLTSSAVEGAKDGLFFFATNGQQANPWGNGTSYQCVVPPVKRCGLLAGTGTVGACDGVLSQDLNALWCPTCPKPGHNPGARTLVQAQLWYRDPLSTSNQTTSLSDAIEFVVGP